MDLKKQDIAELLHVSLSTVDRWIEEGKIPSYTLQGEQRFSRDEIENWMVRSLAASEELPFGEKDAGQNPWQQFGLFRAINKGDVIADIQTSDKDTLIEETMKRISPKMDIDPEVATELLLDRERLMPTALGSGIAVPHTREFLLRGVSDTVVVVYPESPMEWGSLDGSKVHTIFFLFACDDKRHLSLLAKIAHLVSAKESLRILENRPNKSELLEQIKRWEMQVKSESLVTV